MAKCKAKIRNYQLTVSVKLSRGEKIDAGEMDFFARKSIRGLLKAKVIKKNVIEYTGPSGISLSERLKRPFSKYDFFFLMEQIVDLTQKVQANELWMSLVVLNFQNIYMNETTKEIQFIYLPLQNKKSTINFLNFIESIIYSVIPVQDQNAGYLSKFVYFIKGLDGYDADIIEQYIAKEDRSIVNTIKKHNIGQSGFITDKRKDYYEHYHPFGEETTVLMETDETSLLQEDMETGLLNEAGMQDGTEETTLLKETTQTHFPTLHRVLTDEKISINKPVFRIGKEQSYTDYFVNNNSAVSRSHADIVTRGERYFVIDLNSKNRTFINDQALQVQQETEIFDKDRLRLANEEFIFYV